MSMLRQILDSARVRALVLSVGGVALLTGCGQKGPLVLPTGEAAAQRATLPQTLNPAPPSTEGSGMGTANPVPRQ